MNFDRRIGHPLGMAVVALACCLTAAPALAQRTDLATRTGNELGVSVSSYKYNEPGFMSIKANKIGFDYSGTYALNSEWPNQSKGWFLRGDARYATGKGDYSSGASGNLNGRTDWYYEIRGLIGKDFDLGSYTLSPYAGLGYRHLYNDLRGVTSTGAAGYRRESDYTTLPIGVTHKMILSNQSQLHTTLEYIQLLRGRQDSKLTDSNPATPDVSLRQHSGYGLRLGTMVKYDTWSVGPILTLWRIKQSDIGGTPPVAEPKNDTYEFGIKAAYRF